MSISSNNDIDANELNREIIQPLRSLRHDHGITDSSSRVLQNNWGGIDSQQTQTVNKRTEAYTPPAINNVSGGQDIDHNAAPKEIANLLDSLLSHVHVYMDDYGTACNCNCNCNCNCTRGIV